MGVQISREHAVGGNKTIWVTECGYHNAMYSSDQPGVSELASAKYLPRLWLSMLATGNISRVYFYSFADLKPDPSSSNEQFNWGLLRADGSEKPAFGTIKNMLALFKDSATTHQPAKLEYTIAGQVALVHQFLVANSSGTYFLALWQGVTSFNISKVDGQRVNKDIINAPINVNVSFARNFDASALILPRQSLQPFNQTGAGNNLTIAVPDEVIIAVVQAPDM
eukprot:TRINITY_DN3406_c0_g1_i1.p3 TRINITY_DN3406_c0_g1~~TRINITY_DN3406_c0_g1_i1.p3  ORF type:complete len:223 (+),score=49.77 TRINITY_DN3406_c0_g1_i1:2636-3304(+)